MTQQIELKQKLCEKHIERKAEIAKLKTMIADLSVELSEKRRIIYNLQATNRTIEKSYEKMVDNAYSEAKKIQSRLNDERRENNVKDSKIKKLETCLSNFSKIIIGIIAFLLLLIVLLHYKAMSQ
jgi:chromosome segregation ATPase